MGAGEGEGQEEGERLIEKNFKKRKEKNTIKGEGSEPGTVRCGAPLGTNSRRIFLSHQEVSSLGWKLALHRSVRLSLLFFGLALKRLLSRKEKWRERATCRRSAIPWTLSERARSQDGVGILVVGQDHAPRYLFSRLSGQRVALRDECAVTVEILLLLGASPCACAQGARGSRSRIWLREGGVSSM